MKDRPPARPRNAAATREAILKSARAAFARSGYDGVGVRDIAAGAGVTAMLINRYFGSKEGLFAEVVTNAMTSPVILSRDNLASGDLTKRMARGLVAVSAPGETPLDGFQIMIRSAASDRAAEISRDRIETGHQKTLTDSLEGPHAAERAALALALVAGVQSMRQTIGLKALAQADPEVLEALLERMFEPLVGSRLDDPT